MSALPPNLLELLQQLTTNLAQYQGQHLSLQEKLQALEREQHDRKAILDRFALVSETDTRGVITYVNAKFSEVSGYSFEELVGKPHNIIRHPDMPKSAFKELWDTIKASKIWQGEIKNRRKDGSHYWVLTTIGPLLDAEGYPYQYVSMRVDITHQKDLEEKLRQERQHFSEELSQNLKLAATIQKALLPPLEGESAAISVPYFVLYRPLQEVSGDFFWLHEEKGRLVVFVGDSVGHGIAGSLVSALFIQELRHLVRERGIWSPELLAEELDSRLGQLFARKLSLPITVDGMVALVDLHRHKLSFLGLRGKGVLARGGTLTRLDSFPFSFGELLGRAGTETTLELQPGDRLYFYTDGIHDQEGGPRARRWGNKAWIEYLRDLQNLSLPAQRQPLLDTLHSWQGNQAQTDDILVLGLEVP